MATDARDAPETAQGLTKPDAPTADAKSDAEAPKTYDGLIERWTDLSAKIREKFDPQIAAQERNIQAATGQSDRVAKELVAPAIGDVLRAHSVPIAPPPTPLPTPPVPDQTPRPFLSGAKEPLSKLISGLGLLAQVGMAGKAPVAALNALSGAMTGWAKGDEDRAAAEWRQYQQTVDNIRHENQQARQVWSDSMVASQGNQTQALARYAATMGALGLTDRAVAVEEGTMARILGRLNSEERQLKDLRDSTFRMQDHLVMREIQRDQARQMHELRKQIEERRAGEAKERIALEREKLEERRKESDRNFKERVREFNQKFEGAFSVANDPAAIDYAAHLLNERGVMPALGAGMAGARTAILKRAAEMLAEKGQTPQDAVARQQLNRAVQGALSVNMRMGAQLGSFIKTIEDVTNQAEQWSAKVDRTGVPVFNKWMQAGQRSVAGDPDITGFDLANATVAAEFARIMNSATGGGVSTVDARKHANELLSTAQTPEQYKTSLDQIRREIRSRADSIKRETEDLQAITRGGAPKADAPKPGGAATPTEVRVRRKSDGRTGVLKLGPGEAMPAEYEAVK